MGEDTAATELIRKRTCKGIENHDIVSCILENDGEIGIEYTKINFSYTRYYM